jgi:N-acetylglucosaminyldiphosphoundecaprenol N-acetyl-beta-D-mannosaminyltransferase
MKIKFFDYFIFSGSKEYIVHDIFQQALLTNYPINPCFSLFCLNPHSYVLSLNDNIFSKALHSANWLIPDGIGIVLASKFFGNSLIKNRITGADIFYGVSHQMNLTNFMSVFFLGSTEEVLNLICSKLRSDYPNIKIAGVYSPPFKSSYSQSEMDSIISLINESNADVLWVGLTAPKQEKFIFLNRTNLNVKFVGAIGAVFDFYAGTISRAPLIIQKCGLEWLYRFYKQPLRLSKRNLVSSPIFIFLCLKEFVATKFKKFMF